MENITAKIEGQKLILTIDFSKELRPSGSGKTMIVATTSGNVPVTGANGLILGLNAYRKPKAA